MNVNLIPADRSGFKIPRNEYLSAQKVKEVCPEAEFTGLSSNVRIDSRGSRWFLNNDPYTKVYGKYDAYAYEWTVSTGEDYRSSYIQNHPTENMGFEDFLGYVRENGLDKELNESAIRADMRCFNETDYTTLSQQADYFAAYYAHLENHITQNFTGEEKETQMKILNDTVGKAINDVSNAYANYAGGFLEKYGQSGEREKVRMSVNKLIEDKIDSYRKFIKEKPDYANLNGTQDEWLKDSHRFMTSELQKAYAASGDNTDGTGAYSENDLLYIGKIASSLPQNFKSFNTAADEETIGFTLGTVMAKTLELGKAMGISDSASNAIKGAVTDYQQDYIKLINNELAKRKRDAINAREREGNEPLDGQAVMNIALKMKLEYEKTQDLMKTLFKGMSDGFKNHMNKVNSGSHSKLLRYNETDKLFWHKMYSTLDRTESTSMKIERDALIFKSGLDKKNLNVDMGFNSLHMGYFNYSDYSAKPEGKVVSEFLGF
ncbi:MAG: hypothetical protein ACI4KF_11435 [Huintestinicola sp.]